MILKFLHHVLPETGYYCLATPSGNGGYKHKVTSTIPQTAVIVDSIKEDQTDVFFAIGSLQEPFIMNMKKQNKFTGEMGVKEYRVQRNIKQIKSLILDLDCNGVKPTEYSSQLEAIQKLKEFVSLSGMPVPTIVNSGRGIHVYWTLDTAIDADDWYELSLKAVAVYNHFNLKYDSSSTLDRSRVLRVAGTQHCKDKTNLLPVNVIKYGQHTKLSDMHACLDRNINFYNLEVQKRAEHNNRVSTDEIAMYFTGIESNLIDDGELIDLNLVFDRCYQMRRIRDIGGTVGYNLRCSAISIMKRSVDPDYSILSNNDPNPELVDVQTHMALEGSITDNPHTCSRFAMSHPEGCVDCHEKITSPIQLGHKQDESQIEYQSEVVVGEVKPPHPYLCDDTGVKIYLEGGVTDTIYEYKLYPYKRIWDYKDNCEVVLARVHLPHDKDREIVIPSEVVVDTRNLSKLLASNGILAQSAEKTNILANYMSNYIRELQKHFKATSNYAQLGWHDDGSKFVMPELTYSCDGTIEHCGVSSSLATTVKSFRKRGSFDEWKSIINEYTRDGYEPYAFGHLTGYGSLLFELTQYKGAIVNLIGNSGSGKSTVLMSVNSIFGHPDESMLMQHDKYLARMNRIGVFNSLPVTYDEITRIPGQELSELCYSVSQGRTRMRLTQTANEKDTLSWGMIMLCSSNMSLYDILGANNASSDAEAMRVFEYRIDRQAVMKRGEAYDKFSKLHENYGHAGEPFIKYLVTHKDEVSRLIREYDKRFEVAAGVQTQERYWSNVVACCMAGGTIAKRLGLHDFDMEKLFKWVVNQVKYMRHNVGEISEDAKTLLIDFLNYNIGSTVVIYGRGTKASPFRSVEEPNLAVTIRNEVEMGMVYISRSAIKNWLSKIGADYGAVKKDLMKIGILTDPQKRKVLSANSNLPQSGATPTWCININHSEMVGAYLTAVEPIIKRENEALQCQN